MPDPEADEKLVRFARERRATDVRCAKLFARIDAGRHFLLLACASVAEYGVRIGYGSTHARDYTAAGHVLAVCPLAEQWLLDGSMSLSALAILAPFFLEPTLRPVDDQGAPWTDQALSEWARLLPDRVLPDAVRKRRRDVETSRRASGPCARCCT